jgi:hypothetical protein
MTLLLSTHKSQRFGGTVKTAGQEAEPVEVLVLQLGNPDGVEGLNIAKRKQSPTANTPPDTTTTSIP